MRQCELRWENGDVVCCGILFYGNLVWLRIPAAISNVIRSQTNSNSPYPAFISWHKNAAIPRQVGLAALVGVNGIVLIELFCFIDRSVSLIELGHQCSNSNSACGIVIDSNSRKILSLI